MKYILLGSAPEYTAVYYINENGATVSFPFSIDNTDYQQFKIQVADGTPLEDPDGNVMSAEQVSAFLETLP